MSVGVIASGTGAAAVFISDNQAGTAALFVVAVAFLLIGIQGTPLTRFASGDHSAEFAAKHRVSRKAIEDAIQAEQAGNSAAAENLVEFAATLDPSVENLPVVRALRYEQRVGEALVRLFGESGGFSSSTENPSGSADTEADFQLNINGSHIAVDVKFRTQKLGSRDLRNIQNMAARPNWATLVVTNVPLSSEVIEFNSQNDIYPVEIVSWTGSNDDNLLARAAGRLGRTAGQIGTNESG